MFLGEPNFLAVSRLGPPSYVVGIFGKIYHMRPMPLTLAAKRRERPIDLIHVFSRCVNIASRRGHLDDFRYAVNPNF